MAQTTDEVSGQQKLADQASAKVQDAASGAQEKASELRDQGSAWLRDQFDQRSTDAGSQVRSFAEALRRSGNDPESGAKASQWTGPAADRIERLGGYLERKSGDDLMRDTESFARRRPWMIAGVAMLAGIAAARFMKASSEERYGDYRRTGEQRWPTRAGVTDSGRGSYGEGELGSGGYGERPSAGADVPSQLRDEATAGDPYVGRR
jgi:ElaB/YqjD/DUF883 family membrane-anchored ribosome-binding protein